MTLTMTFASTASAGIIELDINQTIIQGGTLADVGGCATGFLGGTIADANLKLDQDCNGTDISLKLDGGQFWKVNGTDLALLGSGVNIDGTSFQGGTPDALYYAMFNNLPTTDFISDFEDMFVAFKSASGKFGYISLDWNFDKDTTIGALTVNKAFYQDTAGVAITTHDVARNNVEVPEPSTLAIFALGIMGLVSRRFKKKS